MLTLIEREFKDNLIFFLIALIASMVCTSTVVWSVTMTHADALPVGIPLIMYQALAVLLPGLALLAAAFGATQMYGDRSKRISTFLSTLATTRGQILAAKMITGVLWILLVLLPLLAADVILLQVYPRVAPLDVSFLAKMFAVTFLCSLACYALGLQMGWNTNRFFPILGSVALSFTLIYLVVVKGFSIQALGLLFVFAVAALTRTWQRFMSIPI